MCLLFWATASISNGLRACRLCVLIFSSSHQEWGNGARRHTLADFRAEWVKSLLKQYLRHPCEMRTYGGAAWCVCQWGVAHGTKKRASHWSPPGIGAKQANVPLIDNLTVKRQRLTGPRGNNRCERGMVGRLWRTPSMTVASQQSTSTVFFWWCATTPAALAAGGVQWTPTRSQNFTMEGTMWNKAERNILWNSVIWLLVY